MFPVAYQRKYLDKVYCIIDDDDDDGEVDRRGEQTKENIENYNIKGIIFNIASAWKDVKTTTLANARKNLLYAAENVEYDFEGFDPNDFHHVLRRAGEEGDTLAEEEEDEGKESDVRISKLSEVRGALDSIITYIDLTADEESNQYYPHFRAFRDMTIRRQRKQEKQLKIHSFFKPVATATQSDSPQVSTSFQSPDSP